MSDEFEIQYALQTNHKHLYHYEPFRPDYLAATLRDQKIHCSVPSHFNDPWDCKPWFDESCIDDPAAFDQVLAWLHWLTDYELRGDAHAEWETELRGDRSRRKEFIETRSSHTVLLLSKRRLYCLTPFAKQPLMWSHYADHHRGICFEFGTDNALIGSAMKVKYRKAYPVWKVDRFLRDDNLFFEMALTKSAAWEYEEEFRIMGSSGEPHPNEYLATEGDYFRLPPNALNSLIAGCASDVRLIKAIVNEYSPGLPVKRAVRIPDKYDLKIED